MPFTSIHPLFLLALLAIVLIIFGPGKLPELGGAVGRSIKEFRKASNELTDEVKNAIETRGKAEEQHTAETPRTEASQGEAPKVAQAEGPKAAQAEAPKVVPADKPDATVEKK